MGKDKIYVEDVINIVRIVTGNLMVTDPEYSLKYNLCKDFLLNKDNKYELIHKDAAVMYYKDRVKALEEENRRLRHNIGLVPLKRK